MSLDLDHRDIVVIGGGIVGAATALALVRKTGRTLVLLEAEDRLAAHQTGHNSGVIHSGLYYKPGSLKARNCVEGREALYRFCADHNIPHQRCGKLVIATRGPELLRLAELELRGGANGLEGVRRLSSAEMREREPHAAGLAALLVPQTGIVDYTQVTETCGRLIREAGGQILTGARVTAIRREPGRFILETPRGALSARFLVNCAGLQSDRVARMCGLDPGLKIVPFRGEYYEVAPAHRPLVQALIYPVPDPRFPFLGVHFTRRVDSRVEAGPNAVLAFKREGYTRFSFSWRDTAESLAYPGFLNMAARHWRMGAGEFYRSFNKRAFTAALQKLVPDIRAAHLQPGGSGVRAQAVGPDGSLIDDFRILETGRMIHVLNAPSPAATAAFSIGRAIAEAVERRLAGGES